MLFTSCKKDYICTCEYNGSTLQYLIKRETKENAETTCKAYEDEANLLTCKLE